MFRFVLGVSGCVSVDGCVGVDMSVGVGVDINAGAIVRMRKLIPTPTPHSQSHPHSHLHSHPHQGERSENVVLHRTSRLCHNCASDLFSYFKSTIDLCYDILAGVQLT